jgi:hypothetical protein
MSDRTAEFEAAIRAQAGLISEAQELLTHFLAKQIEAPALIEGLPKLLDGPEQREADRLARGIGREGAGQYRLIFAKMVALVGDGELPASDLLSHCPARARFCRRMLGLAGASV